jgi:hypothetical protein
MAGRDNARIFEYDLSTAYDLSTISYNSVNLSVSGQDTALRDVKFNTDGTKMYVVGHTSDRVHQYSLSTAFDLSTASYDSVSFDVSSQATFPNGLAFNNDGTKMYIVDDTTDDVFQYTLSTAFDLSSASYDSVSFAVGQDSRLRNIAFNATGTKMFITGRDNNKVFQYSLSTAFDLSTVSYDNIATDAIGSSLSGIAFNPLGTVMFVVSAAIAYQYTVGSVTTITLPNSIEDTELVPLEPDKRINYTFATADSGTNVSIIEQEVVP